MGEKGFFKIPELKSFKGRLRFWFTCLIVFIVLGVSLPGVIFGRGQLYENAVIELDKTMDSYQILIESWISEKLLDIEAISQLPPIRSHDSDEIKAAIDIIGKNNDDFAEITFVNKNGVYEVPTIPELVGVSIKDRIYYKKAKEGETFVTDILIERRTDRPIIKVSAPVYDDEWEFNGLILGSIAIQTINDIMSGYQDMDREIFLVNRNGMLITNSRQGKMEEYIDTAIIKQAIAGNEVGDFYSNLDGEEVLGDYRWIHDNQWLLIGEIKKSVVFESFYRIGMAYFIILLFIIIVGYMLMIKISDRVEQPIKNVLEGTRRIGEGEWGFRLNSYSEREAEEFKELKANFNHMADLIEEYIHSQERFQLIAEFSSDMITIHDLEGKYLYISPAGREILQYNEEEIVGSDYSIFIHPDDREMLATKHKELLKTGGGVRTYRIQRKDGDYIWFESSIKYLQEKSKGEQKIIVISRNITERKLVEEKLKQANELLLELSAKDGLTKAWNRRTFDNRIQEEWERAQKNKYHLGLVMVDIDYFKNYNDYYGHQAGDDCLKQVTSLIQEAVKRSSDWVCRYGGEEFIVILPNTDENGAKIVAENIRKTIEKSKIPHEGSLICDYLTVSVGTAAIVPTKHCTVEGLIEKADEALYRAKSSGRNRVC